MKQEFSRKSAEIYDEMLLLGSPHVNYFEEIMNL